MGGVALLAAATALGASGATRDTRLSLVAYSTPTAAYAQIVPAFQKTPAGKDVSFSQSYGPSGDQAQAILNGLHADVAAFSLEPDMTRLVNAKLVARNWKQQVGYDGIVTRSVVVFVVRNGNPKKIRDWEDLIKPGVDVVTPNPFTSGGAKWNVMAAYGAMRRKGKTDRQAIAYLGTLFRHVVSQDKSARDALNTFLSGRGDVMLAYENEAILARQRNQPVFYVIPKATIRIENPVAWTTNASNPTKARAFVRYLHSPAAQEIFARNGYRPVSKSVIRKFSFPVRPWLFTIQRLGGWAKVDKRFFDPRSSVMQRIEASLGR
jgi:sulfate transport system substrate-binding protein